MEHTDKSIPIECAECYTTHFEEGIGPMIEHLMSIHEYPLGQASEYAQDWAEDAYQKIDEFNYRRAHP